MMNDDDDDDCGDDGGNQLDHVLNPKLYTVPSKSANI